MHDPLRTKMYDPLRAKMKVVFYSAIAFLFGLGIASGLGWTDVSHAMPTLDTQPQIPVEAVQSALDLSDAFVKVAEVVTPAVVRIEARRPARAVSQPSSRFRSLRDPDPRERRDQIAGGSGFIVSEDGYILTNNHVVADATSLTVYLQDRRTFPATLVGRDPFTDVAVIKIDAPGLTHLSFGSSDDLRVGEWIVAIGNPGFGGTSRPLDYTVTVGIVSALGRPLQLLQQGLRQDEETADAFRFAIEDFIQTDAVINPGNSGGPMVNLLGQVVGINSAIASRTGFYQGYGFAIPINLAQRVMEDLVEYGRVHRALLGVAMLGIDAVKAEAYGLPTVAGVEVTEITEGGPAEEYGLRLYDVIVDVDGVPIGRVGQLQQRIAMRRPGDRVSIGVYRDGKPMQVEVRLDEARLTTETEVVAAAPVRAETRMDDKLGLRIEDMTRQNAAQFGYEEFEGALITDIQVNGPASRRGLLRAGWKIVEINREPIRSAADVRRVMAAIDRGDIVTLRLSAPGGANLILHVPVPK